MKIDEKVKFFLKNQKQIEEWNNIRKRAVDAANEFFVSLKPDIEDLAQKLGGDVQCCADFECSTPKYYLFNKGWCSQSNDDVPIGVNFEWSKNNSAFLGACSGIWIHAKAENYDKLSPIYFVLVLFQ